MEMVCTAASMGIRESRRVIGEYTLTYDDYLSRRKFPDQIGMFNKFVDSHVYDDSRAEWERFQREAKESGRLQPGECFGIPYGILVPRGWTNLWVAGRCVSCDIKMHHVVRVMPSAGMMGQAAGTAAVQALRKGQSACALDTGTLVETLRANGAILDQEELAGTMTRCEPALLG